MNKTIQVNQPFLPPQAEYTAHLNGIWDRIWLTNNGPLVLELEAALRQKLGVSHLSYVTNGTIAIQLALKALDIQGEVITTPFSYVATTSSIVWESCTPVFADIHPGTWNLDPASIETRITPNTSAILLTHVFGNPCDIDAIEILANKHGLKVIYDAAHCFGSLYKGKSVFGFGDITTTSFHATKLFHTIEGGAVFTRNSELLQKINFHKNFGHNGPTRFECVGINGKNSEFHAAMGIVNLNYVDDIMSKYEAMYRLYKEILSDTGLVFQEINADGRSNCSYMPVLFRSESQMLAVKEFLETHNIFTRRYFYPALTDLPYCSAGKLPVASDVSARILCLPFYYNLGMEDVQHIGGLIRTSLSEGLGFSA
jgi:dTDP-4-amino-4,6-dideoxygalactose transaminase